MPNVHRAALQYRTMHKYRKYMNIDMSFVCFVQVDSVHAFVQYHYTIT